MLLHADGFDHYGTGLTAAASKTVLTAAGYTVTDNNVDLPVAGGVQPRTGLGMLHFNAYQGGIKYPVSSAVKISGQFGIFWPTLSTNEYFCYSMMDIANNQFLNLIFRSNGGLAVSTNKDGTVTTAFLGTLPPGAYKAGTWQDFEFVYTPNTNGVAPFNGKVEVYLEGVLKLQINGLNIATQVAYNLIGCVNIVGGNPDCYVDDWIINDTTGAAPDNVCPLGPRRVGTRIVNGNGGTNAWTANGAASQWNCVAKNAPNSTSYIEGANAGDIQDFTVPASSVIITGITGVILKAYAQKTSAGVGTFKLGVESGLVVANSPELTPGTGFIYYNSGFFSTDPNTGNPWTKAAYDALGVRCTKVQ